MKKRVSWQAAFKREEAAVNVSVLDTVPGKDPCRYCGQVRLCFYVHLFREENRPIAAMCKSCTSARAGGEEKVYVKTAPGPGLRKRWNADAMVPARSAAQLAVSRRGLAASAAVRAKPSK